MIKTSRYEELETAVREEIESLADQEFGHIPIVKNTQWAQPDWAMIMYEDGQIATFYNIIERTIYIDGHDVKVAGINNVITPHPYRGKGYSTQMLKTTQDFLFEELKCEAGLLLCADDLIPFYSRLDWYLLECPVYFNQSEGRSEWSSNAMLLTPGKALKPREIDLNGLPW